MSNSGEHLKDGRYDRKTAGQVREITSTANPQIKAIKSLFLKKHRDSKKLFIAEGLKLLTDALETGWQIDTVICSRDMTGDSRFEKIAARCRAKGADILVVSNKVLTAISKRDNPQMVIGIYHQQWQDPQQILANSKHSGDVIIALDRVRDPGNLGTIIRTADAVGAKGVLLIGETTDPFSIEATRATMGSIFHMPVGRMGQEEFIEQIPANFRLAGTHLEGAVDYRSINWDEKPAIILMGNEQQGLTDRLAKACSDLLLIPMAGQADSLNLSIATGIVLFESRRSYLKM